MRNACHPVEMMMQSCSSFESQCCDDWQYYEQNFWASFRAIQCMPLAASLLVLSPEGEAHLPASALPHDIGAVTLAGSVRAWGAPKSSGRVTGSKDVACLWQLLSRCTCVASRKSEQEGRHGIAVLPKPYPSDSDISISQSPDMHALSI